MSINRFSLWEFSIGGAATLAAVILTGAPLRVTFLGLLVVALLAAGVARNVLAFVGTFAATWVALPLWGPAVPLADNIPTVSTVITEPTTTTGPTSPAGVEAETSPPSTSVGPAGAEAQTAGAGGAGR